MSFVRSTKRSAVLERKSITIVIQGTESARRNSALPLDCTILEGKGKVFSGFTLSYKLITSGNSFYSTVLGLALTVALQT